ncbi:MAG: cobyric acid synthase [Deltaproteobacteria bacterium]|nr:MAG: cobyric acid synthase [Deltaproteobacteria bacterium]
MPQGKLYVVGIGPGDAAHLTPAARTAIAAASVVAGYRTYLDLIPELLAGKELLASGMREEVERCRQALARAAGGATVALVSGGDAGIYGMAGLALELAAELPVEVEIIPGISALQAAAARLGAPLMHDLAVISLSDLLTPWEVIARRLEAAASADFVVALYNPKSTARTTQIEVARDILLRHRDGATPVGIVRHACREGEAATVTTLREFTAFPIDMFSLVIVGNAATFVDGKGRMITPRGYGVDSGCAPAPLPAGGGSTARAKARALFIGGTGSDVGKSVLAAGLCRLLSRTGVKVLPFKAQNMALNAAVTPDGGEIGRAQALQAAACGVPPHVDMNPVLLKPNSDTGAQVVVHGRPVGNMTVAEYHAYKPEAFARIEASFRRLAARADLVVIEGAGSIAEINLRDHDVANLKVAAMAWAPVLLVADIDRGGVFASIVGTVELLTAEERRLLAGVIINRFRGDASLLAPGIRAIEARTGVPVLGVVPWLDLKLPEEDSVGLARKGQGRAGAPLRIGVVRLPRLSNYTDFDPLEHEPDVDLRYLTAPDEIAGLDLLILPGTKSTLPDLQYLRTSGLARAIHDFHMQGGRIAGICGGYQMLGKRITDPDMVESDLLEAEGLGLLDVDTELAGDKQTREVAGTVLDGAAALGLGGVEQVAGYEIHMGVTTRGALARPLFAVARFGGFGETFEDGAVSVDGRTWGTYLHGLFDDAAVRHALLDELRARRGLARLPRTAGVSVDGELDRLADHLARHLDLERIRALLDLPVPAAD